jgi:hypothetical protein
MREERRTTPGRVPELSGSGPDVAELPPGSYWQAQSPVGEVTLSAHSKVLVSTVLKDGTWYVRLRAYRLAQRGRNQEWVPARQIMIFPTGAIEALRACLALAAEAITAAPGGGDGLHPDELAQEAATELPDREALSLILPGILDDPASAGATYQPDGS